jgi:transcriptional regulator
MYIPAAFAETDLPKLHDFIEQNSFGLLVCQVDGLPFASHLPFLLERTSGPHGTLVGHMARANPQWEQIGGKTALVVFSGPQSEQVVPTWNYTAVHAYGGVELVQNEDGLLDIVQKSVLLYEQSMPQPWPFDPTSVFVKRLLTQIVGFRIKIENIEGKFKLNQNQPVERRQKVVRALQQRGDENALAVAAMMQAKLDKE